MDDAASNDQTGAQAAEAADQPDVKTAAGPEAVDMAATPEVMDAQREGDASSDQSQALPSDGGTGLVKDLIPELEMADPILAAQAGFDLDQLKKAAQQGSIQPDVLKGYIDMATPAEEDDDAAEAMTDLDFQIEGAVRDQYAQFGITADDLRLYLQVSLDIEDAISAGRKPAIDPERYTTYQRVDSLVKYGPEKTPEEAARLEDMAEQEIMRMPWPTPMIREYMKQKGAKLKRMNKQDITTYDKVGQCLSSPAASCVTFERISYTQPSDSWGVGVPNGSTIPVPVRGRL